MAAQNAINPPPLQEALADEQSSWKRWFFQLWAPIAKVLKPNGDLIVGGIPGGRMFAVTTANAPMGRAVLVAGAAVVANTAVTANTNIFVTGQIIGGVRGAVDVTARVPGVSFTLTSTSGADTSTISYLLVEPA